jgi:hypothetical protein
MTSSEISPNVKLIQNPWLRLIQVVWVLLALLSVGVLIAALPGYMQRLSADAQLGLLVVEPSALTSMLNVINVFVSLFAVLLSIVLAAILFIKKSNERMAVFLSFYLLVYAIGFAGPLEALEQVRPDMNLTVYWLISAVLIGPMTVGLFALFPDGRFVPARSRWLVLASLLVFPPTLYLENAFQISLQNLLIWIGGFFFILILVAALYAQIYRYRHISSPLEQQQTKWVVYGIGLWLLLMLMCSIPYYYLLNLPHDSPSPWWVPFTSWLWFFSLTILPISLTIAVMRYRLYDIDILINRGLVYGSLTVMLALVYFGSVVVLQSLFRSVTGQQAPIAIVVSTLIIAALFQPLRQRSQAFVDRRFYRRKYDTEKTLEAFAATVRDEVDLNVINETLLNVAVDTMQPTYVSLWLREREGRTADWEVGK